MRLQFRIKMINCKPYYSVFRAYKRSWIARLFGQPSWTYFGLIPVVDKARFLADLRACCSEVIEVPFNED